MKDSVLGPRALNRTLLARQLLLERARIPIPRALERVAGLQAQYAPSAYIGLWSRVDGFERNRLTRALEREAVLQGTLMRATIHMVSASDYPLLAGASVAPGRSGGSGSPVTVASTAKATRESAPSSRPS